jgi:hypothetical protein
MPFVYTEDWAVTVESGANAGLQTQAIDTRTVSADYFTTMQIPLAGGQVFTAEDGPQSVPVVVVNQAMANRYWPNQDPVGKRIKIGNQDSKSPWFAVKGVIKDSAQSALDQGIRPEIYFSMGQMAGRYRRMNLAVRTSVDPKSTLAAIQSAIREVDKDQPVYQVQTIDELIGDSVGTRRFALTILILFAALALVLAVSGIYGVISYSVTQRTQEIGMDGPRRSRRGRSATRVGPVHAPDRGWRRSRTDWCVSYDPIDDEPVIWRHTDGRDDVCLSFSWAVAGRVGCVSNSCPPRHARRSVGGPAIRVRSTALVVLSLAS